MFARPVQAPARAARYPPEICFEVPGAGTMIQHSERDTARSLQVEPLVCCRQAAMDAPAQTLSAAFTISSSFRHCAASESSLPCIVEAKPHCGEMPSWETSRYFAALSIFRTSEFGRFNLGHLGVDDPHDHHPALGHEAQRLVAALALDILPFDKECVIGQFVEHALGYRLKRARYHEARAPIAATQMNTARHVVRKPLGDLLVGRDRAVHELLGTTRPSA